METWLLITFDSLIILFALYGAFSTCCCLKKSKPILNDINYIKYNTNNKYVIDIDPDDEEFYN